MAANGSDHDRTRSFTALAAGTKVSHYTIVSKIGAGGMGEVYLAEDATLDRRVALKFLPQHLSDDEASRARFTREAKAAAKLDHPNIVPVYEVGEFQGRPFFAMAHIEGPTLRDVIKLGKLSVSDAVEYISQICEGLHKAHESGVVHRDVKPGNIIIDSENRARLVDFGLATVAGEKKLTKTGSTVGTMGYMSPEQVSGRSIDHRSDLFSVGVILYEILTSRRPFEGDNDAAVIKAITDVTPEPVARFKSGTSAELQLIIDKALAKDPAHRYQHADGMLADLQRLNASPTLRSKSNLGWLLGITVFAAIITASIFLSRSFDSQGTTDENEWSNSIAVLVFRNLSADPDQVFFCEAMTEAIIGRLSGVQRLKVISLNSVLNVAGTDLHIREMGELLGVQTILSGSIQREHGRIRVQAQLVDVNSDTHLWSDRFDRKIESLFDVQDDLSRAIVEAMKIEFLGNEEATMVKRGTNSLEAYHEYAHGRHLWRKRTVEGLRNSIEHFERAIELDSAYALAYSGLADAYNILGTYSNVEYSDIEEKILEAAQRAVDLDGNSAEARTSLASAYWNVLSDVNNAEIEFKRAIELNPCYSWAHLWYGVMLERWWKDSEGATRQYELALECDPLSIVALNNVAAAKSMDGEFLEAERLYAKIWEIEPTNASLRANATAHFLRAGKLSEARMLFETAVKLEPTTWWLYREFAGYLHTFGYKEEANSIWRNVIAEYPEQATNYCNYGLYLSDSAKEYDGAIEQFKEAIQLDPNFYAAYQGMAKAHYAIGEYDNSIRAAQEAVNLRPDQVRCYLTLGNAYLAKGNRDSALSAYMTYLSIKPNHTYMVNRAGYVASLIGQYALADSLFGIMVSHVVPNERAWGRKFLVDILMQRGRLRDALRCIDSGVALDQEEVGTHRALERKYYQKGEIHLLFLGNPDSAIAAFEIARKLALELDSPDPGTWALFMSGRIAESYCMKGDFEEARSVLTGVLPDSIDGTTRAKMARINAYRANNQRLQGEFDAAAKAYDTIIHDLSHHYRYLSECGQAYYSAGRVEDAIEMFVRSKDMFGRGRRSNPWYEVLLYYYLGKAFEAAGRYDDAIAEYDSLLRVWDHADEDIELLKEVKIRHARLRAEDPTKNQ